MINCRSLQRKLNCLVIQQTLRSAHSLIHSSSQCSMLILSFIFSIFQFRSLPLPLRLLRVSLFCFVLLFFYFVEKCLILKLKPQGVGYELIGRNFKGPDNKLRMSYQFNFYISIIYALYY